MTNKLKFIKWRRSLTAGCLLFCLLTATAQPFQDEGRKLWDTLHNKNLSQAPQNGQPALHKDPRAKRTYRKATPNIPSDQVAEDTVVGVTLWLLQPAQTADSAGARLLVQTGGQKVSYTPQRVEAETKLVAGQRVRLSIEAARAGYVYVINREEYANGTFGEPELLFPTDRLYRRDNRVSVGRVIEVPLQTDLPPYFSLRPSRADQVGESISVLVTAQPLKLPKPLEPEPISLPSSLFAQWERAWGQRVGRFELENGKGQAWTAAERDAGADSARKLTQDEPYPQSLYYRAGAKAGESVLVTIPLRYAEANASGQLIVPLVGAQNDQLKRLDSVEKPNLVAPAQNDQPRLKQTDSRSITTLPGQAKRWALVVGVDQYQDSQISRFNGADNDAKALAEALTRYAGFPADQVILLATDQPEDRQPTSVNILRRLSNLRTIVPKDGLLLVSFAGHGMERNGQAYLLPSDSQVSGDIRLLEETAIHVNRMKAAIRETGVKQILLILDACRNDLAGRANADNPLTLAYTRGFNFDVRNQEVNAFVTLYATAVGQRAYEYKEKRQGYFTWELVEALKGRAANEKGEVTLAGLVRHLQTQVPKRVKLELGKDQIPYVVIEGYKADELVIAYMSQSTQSMIPVSQNVLVPQNTNLIGVLSESTFDTKVNACRKAAEQFISRGELPEAIQAIEQLKLEEYSRYHLIPDDKRAANRIVGVKLIPEELSPEKAKTEKQIEEKIEAIGDAARVLITKSSRTVGEEARLNELLKEEMEAERNFQEFLEKTIKESGEKGLQAGEKLRSSQALMSDLKDLEEGAVALYTVVGKERYSVILVTPSFRRGWQYPIKAADLKSKVLAFRESLRDSKKDPLPLAKELYRILIGPIAQDLKRAKAQTLMWMLDDILRYLPIAALHDGEKYLVETYRNEVFTLASYTRLKEPLSPKWTALGLGVTKEVPGVAAALPAVRDELQGIVRVPGSPSGILPGLIRLDEEFTSSSILNPAQRYKVVHIASHFRFQPGNADETYLLLGDGQTLTLSKIKNSRQIFSGVELLALSACDTAMGSTSGDGREVESFAELSQRQGAKAILASLWPVSDKSTALLMQKFYRLRESQPQMSKAEALRQAQLELLRGTWGDQATQDRRLAHENPKATSKASLPDLKTRYSHPYYWAPFILVGNWK